MNNMLLQPLCIALLGLMDSSAQLLMNQFTSSLHQVVTHFVVVMMLTHNVKWDQHTWCIRVWRVCFGPQCNSKVQTQQPTMGSLFCVWILLLIFQMSTLKIWNVKTVTSPLCLCALPLPNPCFPRRPSRPPIHDRLLRLPAPALK